MRMLAAAEAVAGGTGTGGGGGGRGENLFSIRDESKEDFSVLHSRVCHQLKATITRCLFASNIH
jgi:hypothetical protein